MSPLPELMPRNRAASRVDHESHVSAADESPMNDAFGGSAERIERENTATPRERPLIPAALFGVRDALALHRIGRQREALRVLRETESAVTDAQTALWLCDVIAEIRERVTAAMRDIE